MQTDERSTKPSGVSLVLEAPSATPSLARRAASGTAATMASRVLGVVRESVLASLFGPGNEMDAYRIAFRIPNILRDLFAEGAMSAAFVPTFTRRLTTGGHAAALKLCLNVTNALLIFTGMLVFAGIVFAEPLVYPFVTEKYAAIPGQIDLTVLLSRIMMPFLAFIAVAAAAMAMLNALHHFFLPALSPAVFNVVSITLTVLLVPVMPHVGLPAVAAIAMSKYPGAWLRAAFSISPATTATRKSIGRMRHKNIAPVSLANWPWPTPSITTCRNRPRNFSAISSPVGRSTRRKAGSCTCEPCA